MNEENKEITDIEVMDTHKGIIKPVTSKDEIVKAFDEYKQLEEDVLDENDYMYFVEDDKGKIIKAFAKKKIANNFIKKYSGNLVKRKKKSACAKMRTFFGLSQELIKEERDSYDDYFEWNVTYKTIAPNGRFIYSDGSCSSNEREFSKDHDIRATAHTRAKNRGVLDLVGWGEVSAEEIGHKEEKEIQLDEIVDPENLIVGFGKHSGKKLIDIPSNYLSFLVDSAKKSNYASAKVKTIENGEMVEKTYSKQNWIDALFKALEIRKEKKEKQKAEDDRDYEEIEKDLNEAFPGIEEK